MPTDTSPAVFFLTNPNSPLGTSLEPEFVAGLAERLNGLLVVDEAYADFATTNCLSLCRDLPNVIVTRSLSKSYSLAGLRVGFAFGSSEYIAEMNKVRDHYNLNRIAQAAATAALSEQDVFKLNLARVLGTRQRLFNALRSLNLDPVPSETNFVFVRLASADRAREIYQELLSRSVLVRYFDHPALSNGLRVTVGTTARSTLSLKPSRTSCSVSNRPSPIHSRSQDIVHLSKDPGGTGESLVIRRMFEEGDRLKRERGPENVLDLTLGNPFEEPPRSSSAVTARNSNRHGPASMPICLTRDILKPVRPLPKRSPRTVPFPFRLSTSS